MIMNTQSRNFDMENCPRCAAKANWLRNGSSWRTHN